MKFIKQLLPTKQTILLLLVAILLFSLSHALPSSASSGKTIVAPATGISVSVDPGGAYTITAQSPAWSFGGNIGTPLSNMNTVTGSDNIGSYKEITFAYTQQDAPRSAGIRLYDNKPVVLFTDTYLALSSNSAPFPRLTSYPQGLFHISYSGQFAGHSFSTLTADSPWTFFDNNNDAFILSPASNFMVAGTTQEQDGSIESGINPTIATLPQGFTQKTMLVIGHGINATFDMWGHAITDLSGKTRPANDADTTLNYLGYWTDTGGAYYYNYNHKLGYTGTLLAVRDSFQKLGIPLGYMELDSWFYPKGSSKSWQGDPNNDRGGIYLYHATPALFPHGLKAFQQELGLPLVTHARWIDPSSPYRKHYLMSNNVSVDPLYWAQIASYLKDSGVIAYKQDWLNARALPETNLTDPQAFMNDMATALAANGIDMQYCMPLPRHFLQSSLYNNLMTMRVSPDHFTRSNWDWFLYTSRLAGALGVWPYSDVFMSTETDNLLLSTLSAGIVGVGDPIGAESKTNLLQAVRTDGVIVKPDVPIVPVDEMYTTDALGLNTNPMIAYTYTDHNGLKDDYVFAYKRGDNTTVRFSPSALGVSGSAYVYNYFTGAGQVVQPGGSFSDTINDSAYYIVAPINASGIAFLGDAGKFVTLGKKRVAQLSDNGEEVEATFTFASGETQLTMIGYSSAPPAVSASKGTVGPSIYDTTTHLFKFVVSPAADGSAIVTIGQMRS